MIKLPIEIGDILLVGRFKNKRIKVKEIGTDEHGLPTVNGRGILKIRIEKLMKTKKQIKENVLYPELQSGSKIKVRKDDRSGIFIDGVVTDRKGNYISYKTSMGFGGINLEAKNLGDTIQFDSLKENMKKNLKESVFNANKNDKFLLYRKPANSPSPGHGEYLFASGNTLDELFDNWIKVMKMGGYGYSGSELERQKSLFQKDKLKYWSRPESFYTLKVKRKSDLNQLKMDQDHRKSMAAKDFDNDPRESKQFSLAQTVKKILKENRDPVTGNRVEVTFIGSNPKYKQFKNKPFIDVLTGIESPSTEPYTVYYFKKHGKIVFNNDWNFKVIG